MGAKQIPAWSDSLAYGELDVHFNIRNICASSQPASVAYGLPFDNQSGLCYWVEHPFHFFCVAIYLTAYEDCKTLKFMLKKYLGDLL
jgi:hypothetical protein